MKNSLKLAIIALLASAGLAFGMNEMNPKVIIQNEAWSYGMLGGYYDIKVSINNSDKDIQILGGQSDIVGNLNNINQIKIRRSGFGSGYVSSYSYITADELDELKREALINPGKDLTIIIGATTSGFSMYTHYWSKILIVNQKPQKIDKTNPWSVFPEAEKIKDASSIDFFGPTGTGQRRAQLIAMAKLILGFKLNDQPSTSDIKKRYAQLQKQFHPDKVDLSASSTFDTFAEEIAKIVVRAYEILTGK